MFQKTRTLGAAGLVLVLLAGCGSANQSSDQDDASDTAVRYLEPIHGGECDSAGELVISERQEMFTAACEALGGPMGTPFDPTVDHVEVDGDRATVQLTHLGTTDELVLR